MINELPVKRESGVEFTVNCDSEVPQDDERKDGSSSGISEADQLSEYDDDSSDDNDSVLEVDGAEPQLLDKELGFLFTAPRTRSGRMLPGHRTRQFFGCSFQPK